MGQRRSGKLGRQQVKRWYNEGRQRRSEGAQHATCRQAIASPHCWQGRTGDCGRGRGEGIRKAPSRQRSGRSVRLRHRLQQSQSTLAVSWLGFVESLEAAPRRSMLDPSRWQGQEHQAWSSPTFGQRSVTARGPRAHLSFREASDA